MDVDFNLPECFLDLLEPHRYKVYYGGRGGGKSWAFADTLLINALQRPYRVLCARELQVSIADSVHHLLASRIESLGLSAFYEIQEKHIYSVNGSEFIFKGLRHNVTGIRSAEGIDVCWVEEAENVSRSSWEVLIPTIRQPNSEIWISFNTKHPTDATYQRFVFDPPPDAIVRKVSYQDNPYFPAVLDRERMDMQRRDPEAYRHIWEGEFDTRYSGAVYAKLMASLQEKGRISPKVQHDPAYPVYTCWDLGYDDATAIWFYQLAPKEILFIDYYENNLEGIGHYCDHLKLKPYQYHTHYVPHDAAHKLQAAGGRSIIEQANALGVKMVMIPATSQQNGIEAVRKVLPSCFFNTDTCSDGIEAMMSYHFEYSEDLGRFKSQPVHDWSSHACKAMELACRAWVDKVTSVKQIADRQKEVEFFRKRRQHNLESVDPYRMRKKT